MAQTNTITLNQYKAIGGPAKHKFNAKQTTADGIKFASKKEAAYYQYLKHQRALGYVLFFLRQTPFHLPGNIKYLTDFTVFYSNGTVDFIDVKGRDTPLSLTKRKMVEDIYGVQIKIV